MIPKKIHYCWLSGEKMPKETLKCIASWKRIMPEYEFKLWDMSKFDVNSILFTKEACEVKKWASAADYIRMYAIYTEGGIYMDTDVYVFKSFNDFLENDFFTSLEYNHEKAIMENAYELLNEDGTLKNLKDRIFTRRIGIQAAILGGVKGHPFAKACMDFFKDKRFVMEDGSYYNKIIAPAIFADVAYDFGFRYKDELQLLDNKIKIYPSNIFARCVGEETKDSYALHCCNGSWRDIPKRNLFQKIKNKLSKIYILRKIFGKKTFKLK